MDSISFGTSVRKCTGENPEGRNPDQPLDAVWVVLDAANDLGDHATIEVCRRIIDANLTGASASQADLYVVTEYFR